MNINIQNNNEFLKSEFIDQANVLGVKVYNEGAVLGLMNVQRGLIEKAEIVGLSEEEKSQLDVCKAELQSIKKVVLVNDELKKENWFIRTSKGADIEKSKKANVGEIHEWNGKRYRKEATGKWVEVSEHGMSKKEHEFQSDVKKESASLAAKDKKYFTRDTKLESSKLHSEQASKLSDKEHTDEEVGIGKKNSVTDLSIYSHKEGGMAATGKVNGQKVTIKLSKDFLNTVSSFDDKESREKVKEMLLKESDKESKPKSEGKEKEEGIWSQKNAAKQMSEAAKRNAPN